MPGQGRKRAEEDIAPVVEGEMMPSRLEELDEPAGRDGSDELDEDAVEKAEDEDEDEDDDEEDEDEDEEAAEDER